MSDADYPGMGRGRYSEVERRILELCDLEKKRIGRDLHDGVGQLLTGISLQSKALAGRLKERGCPESSELQNLATMVDDVIKRIREVVAGMAPSEIQNQDAATALQQLCQQIEDIHHIRCVFSAARPSLLINNPDIVKHLYFIAAESIHNAIRHGEADQIEVRLCQGTGPHQGELIIQNNGNCHPEDFSGTSGIGLCGMQFRAQALNGRLAIERYPDHTVAVICSFGPITKGS
jgi:two-component system sensor kinase FixL